jgi:hypothetical protein
MPGQGTNCDINNEYNFAIIEPQSEALLTPEEL